MSPTILALLLAATAAGEQADSSVTRTGDDERFGWHFAGLPLVNFNSDAGAGYGVRFASYDHGANEKPYRLALIAQFFQTTNGVAAHRLQIDAPRLGGSKWRLGAQVHYSAERYSNYFGIGNEATRDPDLITCQRSALQEDPNRCPGNPSFIGARYYNFSKAVPALVLNARRDLADGWQLFVGYRFRYFDLELGYPEDELGQDAPSRLREDLDTGVELVGLELDGNGDPRGQREGDLRVGILYDTRDNEPAPNAGVWHALVVRAAGPIAGGRYWYGGATLNLRAYQTIAPRLVLAGRLLADFTFGDVPFYQLSQTGGFRDASGLGGGGTLRGVVQNRFIGKIKVTSSAELRYRVTRFDIWGQDVDLTVMAGFDAGRVWEGYSRDGPLFNLATGATTGLYAAWNDNFIVRVDYAQSFDQDTAGLYIDFNHFF